MHRRRFVIILVLSLWVLAGILAPMCGSHVSRHGHGLLYQYFLRSCAWDTGDAPQPDTVHATDDPHAAGLASPYATRESTDASSERRPLLRLAFCNGSSLVPEVWPTLVFLPEVHTS